MSQKMRITEWALEDRPREKLMLKGIQALSNAELIAILIGSGNRNETAVELSQRILSQSNNSLNALGKRTVSELVNDFEGIGEAKAISIIAALELGRRRKSEETPQNMRVGSSKDIFNYMYALLADILHEEFWVILLSRANHIVDRIKVGQGGVSNVLVDVKMVLKPALLQSVSAIIICHNHPSGNTQPSGVDNQLTQRIKEGAALLDIELLDHLIFCQNHYFSYADEGKL